MTSTYDEIIGVFLSKVTDPDFVSFSEETVLQLMQDWIHTACQNKYVRSIFSYIRPNDADKTVLFELKYLDEDENSDKDFVCDLIARGMVVAWLDPKVKSIANINQMFGTKESKFYSQSSHLKEIRALLDDEKASIRKIVCDYSYMNNSYLKGDD